MFILQLNYTLYLERINLSSFPSSAATERLWRSSIFFLEHLGQTGIYLKRVRDLFPARSYWTFLGAQIRWSKGSPKRLHTSDCSWRFDTLWFLFFFGLSFLCGIESIGRLILDLVNNNEGKDLIGFVPPHLKITRHTRELGPGQANGHFRFPSDPRKKQV